MIKKYIFLGAPGVGKGTMAQMVEKEYGLVHISTGDIFRKHIKDQTELGKQVKAVLDSGDYVSDKLTNAIIKEAITSEKAKTNGFILDGYPRTIAQAQFLKDSGIDINGAVLLQAQDKVVIQRLVSRARGEDDTPEVIKHRLDVYNQKTKPLIDFYKDENLLIEINAEGSIKENMEQIKKVLF